MYWLRKAEQGREEAVTEIEMKLNAMESPARYTPRPGAALTPETFDAASPANVLVKKVCNLVEFLLALEPFRHSAIRANRVAVGAGRRRAVEPRQAFARVGGVWRRDTRRD